MSKVSLIPACERPDLARIALAWSLEFWGERIPGYSTTEWNAFYEKGISSLYDRWDLNGVDQEWIYLGVQDGELVGAIALVDFDDLEEFRCLKPWIAGFVVREDLRGQGIGRKMLQGCEQIASSLGITRVYLWTEDQTAFYMKHGYECLQEGRLGSLSFDILYKDLQDLS